MRFRLRALVALGHRDLSLGSSELPAGPTFNVRQLFVRMAEGIRERKAVSPSFDLVVKRHELLDAIQRAPDTGLRQTL